jgi:diapolycopene oxygenase
MSGKKIMVIGAGLGGLSAAISLQQAGYAVEVFEKNGRIGGKLNVLTERGYKFDLGPSVLTLPHIFARLFERSGRKMTDYVRVRTLRPLWRNFFEDGVTLDLFAGPEKMAAEARKVGEPPENIQRFLKYSAALYDLADEGYFQEGLENWRDFARHYGPWKLFQFDPFRSMHQGVTAHFQTRYFRDIFDFFSQYAGSSPHRAPAFMNALATVQFRYDLWYVEGGLYNLAIGLGRLMEQLGIKIHLNAEVAEVRRVKGRVSGLVANGTFHAADIIVSNMDVIPAYEKLLREDDAFMVSLDKKYEPACSGLVLDLGLDCQYPQLAHHNCFFSGSQREQFDKIFQEHKLPGDPTIYVAAASRTDPTVAPSGCDALKILANVPCIDDAQPLTREDYLRFKERILDKLERMGLKELRRHVVFEHAWTPLDIRAQYYSNQGSIYGVVSDRWKNLAFKAPKQSPRYPNLFFVGGSVNPGGGMSMVVLCGQNVAKKIVAWDRGG